MHVVSRQLNKISSYGVDMTYKKHVKSILYKKFAAIAKNQKTR